MASARNMHSYEIRQWDAPDGTKLSCRDYAGGKPGQPPVLCIAGLTRNARDFEDLAERLAPKYRVIALDLRGRGKSEAAKDAMSYVPLTYAADVLALLDALEIPKVVAIGTSLGGIVAMLIAAMQPDRLAGAVLNDVGPVLDPAGLGRIRTYVGKQNVFPTWMHAARAVAEGNGDVYPGFELEDWLAMAKRLYRLNSSGRIVLDYDMRIAEPFKVPGNEAAGDMWAAFEALDGKPLLVVRGARSDVLAADIAKQMVARHAGASLVTVKNVGHTPLLTESEVVPAIEKLVAKAVKEPVAA